MVQGHQPLLRVHAGAHLLGGPHQYANLATVDLGEQGLLLQVGVGVMYKGDFVRRYPGIYQPGLHVIVDRKRGVDGVEFVRAHVVQLLPGRLVAFVGSAYQCLDARALAAHGALGRGQVAENQLGALHLAGFLVLVQHVGQGDSHFAFRVE